MLINAHAEADALQRDLSNRVADLRAAQCEIRCLVEQREQLVQARARDHERRVLGVVWR